MHHHPHHTSMNDILGEHHIGRGGEIFAMHVSPLPRFGPDRGACVFRLPREELPRGVKLEVRLFAWGFKEATSRTGP